MAMALADVAKACLDSIDQVSEHVKDAVVYLDSGCTESFQYVGAFPLLVKYGARAVCSLENSCPLDAVANLNPGYEPASKVVVFTSRLLSDAHRYILRCLSAHQAVRHCIVFTSISEIAHSAYPDSPLGPDAFHEYELLLLQDYEELVKRPASKSRGSEDSCYVESSKVEDRGWSEIKSSEEDISHHEHYSTVKEESDHNVCTEDIFQKLVVSVQHFPLVLCSLSPRVFVLPSDGSVAEAYLSAEGKDSLSPGLPPISTGVVLDGDETPPGALLTANFLYHLAAKMDLKLEIFSLGDLSKAVGKIMTDMSSLYDVGRRKRSAGLLLLDRTLDLLTPCCHGDSLFDRMFSALPRRERASANSQPKGSQAQLKLGPPTVQHPSLDVQIPLADVTREANGKMDSHQLSESIDAFLAGWDSDVSAPGILDFLNRCHKTNDNKSTEHDIQLLNGSFVSTETFRGTPYLEAILDRRAKDGAVLVKKWLQESLRRENASVNVKTRAGFATKSELQLMINALAKSQSSLFRNKGIIQLATAVLAALDESEFSRWDAFMSAEKILTASAGETSQSLAAQIGDLINKSAVIQSSQGNDGTTGASSGLLAFQDALLLMITGYILAGENFPTSGSGGPFSWQEEHFLKEAIVDAILENPSAAKLKFLHGLAEELEANLDRKSSKGNLEASDINLDDFDEDQWGKWGDEEEENDDKNNDEQSYDDMQLKLELRDRVDNLFKFLHKLCTLRRSVALREGSLYSESNFIDPELKKGLLFKLLTKVLSRNDVPGLEYHSSTVGRLFKSGFGRFGLGQAKPTLADQNVIMVFIIGGISGIEVREATEAIAEVGRPEIELIVGGTTLLTPNDMLDLLIGNSSYL